MAVSVSNLSDAQWDQFAAVHPAGHVLQSSTWGAMKARHGWRPLRVALTDAAGQPIAGAQLLLRQMRLATVAYIPRGPVALPADLPALLPHVHAAARRAGAVFLKVEPQWEGDGAAIWQAQGFSPAATVQPPSTILLDLTQSEDDLLAAMKQKWRYNIRLAAKKGVTVRPATRADLPAWYALMQVTGGRDGFGVHSFDYYADAYDLFCDGNQGVLLLAEVSGAMLGGVMVFAFGPEAVYMYGASGNSHRNLMPNHALQWQAIRWARERGCQRYDFWGIPAEVGPETPTDADPDASDDATPRGGLWGVYRFKQGFGGRVVRYAGAFDYVYNPTLYWAGTSLLPRLRTLVRRG